MKNFKEMEEQQLMMFALAAVLECIGADERDEGLIEELFRRAEGGGIVDDTDLKRDLSTCPNCGGPADNGHDREFPPNPYLCTKCENMSVEDLNEN